jgi:hypothetical protein
VLDYVDEEFDAFAGGEFVDFDDFHSDFHAIESLFWVEHHSWE